MYVAASLVKSSFYRCQSEPLLCFRGALVRAGRCGVRLALLVSQVRGRQLWMCSRHQGPKQNSCQNNVALLLREAQCEVPGSSLLLAQPGAALGRAIGQAGGIEKVIIYTITSDDNVWGIRSHKC